MPQRPQGEWKKMKDNDPDKYESYNNRLGNLTFIKDKINMQISNYSFEVKKKGYKPSRLNINYEILKNKNWTYQAVDKRQEKLYELSKDIWLIP